MIKRISLILIACNVLIQLNAQTYDVLFIGNSYTAGNNLSSLVANLASSNGDSVYYDSSNPGGYTFNLHKDNQTTLDKIKGRDWDFVILQEQSQIPSLPQSITGTDWSIPHARALDSLIKDNNACTETVFYMTWGRRFGDQQFCGQHPPVCTYNGMQQELKNTYLFMANDNDATVAPVGMAWKAAMEADSSLNLYTGDNSHPNANGSYLAACVFYATIFQKSPVGLSYHFSLDSATATFLQTMANQVVFDSLDLWRIDHELIEPEFSGSIDQSDSTLQLSDSSLNTTGRIWVVEGDTLIDTSANPTFKLPSLGTYTVTLITYNDCDTATTTLEFIFDSWPGINDHFTSLPFRAYPNPFKDQITIESLRNGTGGVYQVSDQLGKIVAYGKFEETQELNTSTWPSGHYILSISGRHYSLVKK